MFPLTQLNGCSDPSREHCGCPQPFPTHSVRHSEPNQDIRVDTSYFVGSIAAESGTVRQLQDPVAMRECRRGASSCVTTTGTGCGRTDDDRGFVAPALDRS